VFWLNQERSPPVIDDFLYVCDDAFTRDELLEMEKQILKAADFDIGIPLSYTFLRRYAQVGSDQSECVLYIFVPVNVVYYAKY